VRPATRHTDSRRQATETAQRGPEPAVDAGPRARRGQGGRRGLLAPAVALVVALAVLGTVLGLTLRGGGAQAGADRAATSAAKLGLEQILSYNYKTFDTQAAAAQNALTGSFKGEFASAMQKQIKPLATKNQTVVQAKVSEVGVIKGSEGSVTVLAFVNQAKVGSESTQPTLDQNRVIATLTKVGERWLISDLQAF
jgi:Mce-associated membrane protein